MSPRMTTRRWMVAVAVVAIVAYGALLARRASDLRRVARQHRQNTAGYLKEEQWRSGFIQRLEIAIAKSKRTIADDEAMISKGPPFDLPGPASKVTAQEVAQRAAEWEAIVAVHGLDCLPGHV